MANRDLNRSDDRELFLEVYTTWEELGTRPNGSAWKLQVLETAFRLFEDHPLGYVVRMNNYDLAGLTMADADKLPFDIAQLLMILLRAYGTLFPSTENIIPFVPLRRH